MYYTKHMAKPLIERVYIQTNKVTNKRSTLKQWNYLTP